MSESKLQSIDELRNELWSVFRDLRAGEIKSKETEALANLAGKIINASKVQVAYYALRKDMPQIKFLEEPTGTAEPPLPRRVEVGKDDRFFAQLPR